MAVPQGVSRDRIGHLLLGVLAEDKRYVYTESEGEKMLDGRYTVCTDLGDGLVRYEYGTRGSAERRKSKTASVACKLTDYPSSTVGLHLRLPSQRYFEDGAESELSPRDFGILMHRAFEQAATEADIFESVGRMCADGILSEADAERLRAMITEALSDATIRSWFSADWDEVRTESEIVLPSESGGSALLLRRPDRVMIRGCRAVVVDYKFGMKSSPSYHRQIAEYMRLLSEMGYTEIEGYVWYVRLGQTERVERGTDAPSLWS